MPDIFLLSILYGDFQKEEHLPNRDRIAMKARTADFGRPFLGGILDPSFVAPRIDFVMLTSTNYLGHVNDIQDILRALRTR